MGSRSTNTYSELIQDYDSTRDSTLWQPKRLSNLLATSIFNKEDMVVALFDEDYTAEEEVPALMSLELMEEMMMEPVLAVSESCKDTVEALCSPQSGDLVVSLSTYGIKHLMFRLVGCLLCINPTLQKVCVPSRLIKKVYTDLKCKGIECSTSAIKSKNVYTLIDIPQKLQSRCNDIYMQSNILSATSNHKQLLNDSFESYCVVDLTMSIVLEPNRKSPQSDSSGNIMVQHDKRTICICPLWIDLRTKDTRNIVAKTTKDVDYYREIREWSPQFKTMRPE